LGLVVALAAGCSSASKSGANGSGGFGTGGTDAGGAAGAAGADAGIQPAETVVVIGDGVPSDAPTKFGGPEDAFAKPEIVYPNDGIVTPPNLNSLEVHFKPGTGQDLFEIRFESPAIALLVYTKCNPVNSGCAYQTEQTFWEQLVGKNKGLPPVTYRVRGISTSVPNSVVGTSDTRSMAFAKENIIGGLYYWNTGGVIQRYEFGSPLQNAELYMTPQMAGAAVCVGCHALSHDGKKMAIGADIPAPAPFKVFDVATRVQLTGTSGPMAGASNFSSFNKDGSKMLYSDGVKIGLFDSVTGTVINDTLIPLGTMPDFSPDGKLIVYARPQIPPPLGFPNPGVGSASIEVVSFDNDTVGPPTYLAQFQGQNNYYPAFSPTKDWVVFNRSPSNAESFGNAPPAGDGELWAVESAGGQAPVRMDAANEGGGTSWPKWIPNVTTYYGGTIMFLTFSTGRAYGLRLPQGQQTQLWMIGFDPKKAKDGMDPSLPSFWFPYQDISGGNYIAQWVTKIERQPCVDKNECKPGEQCIDGYCYPEIK
jgi:hypothetical protein